MALESANGEGFVDDHQPNLECITESGKIFTKDGRLKCFVVMPFGSRSEYAKGELESNYVYKHIICPALDRCTKAIGTKIEMIREADKTSAGSITKSILLNLAKADICIVDITGLNPNVFFELGIRYCLKDKVTILLKQHGTAIPFDISGFRCISYECYLPDAAISAITDFLVASQSESRYIDSLVFETFPEMRVEIPGLVESFGEKSSNDGSMSWVEWWTKVLDLSRLLREPFENGRYVPSAVLGISNGGLMLADLLGREVFKGIPVLSLWANRFYADKTKSPGCYYFDNPYNKAMIQTVKVLHGEAPSLLLVDDIVSTGATIEQATSFLRNELGPECQILFTPLYCRSADFLEPIQHLLPTGYKKGTIFQIDKTAYVKSLANGGTFLPYKKQLNDGRPYQRRAP